MTISSSCLFEEDHFRSNVLMEFGNRTFEYLENRGRYFEAIFSILLKINLLYSRAKFIFFGKPRRYIILDQFFIKITLNLIN